MIVRRKSALPHISTLGSLLYALASANIRLQAGNLASPRACCHGTKEPYVRALILSSSSQLHNPAFSNVPKPLEYYQIYFYREIFPFHEI